MIQSYPWYIADWRESETRMRLSLPERALYRELLDYCYLEGSLPTDPIQLSRIAGCTPGEIKKHWPAVQPLFYRRDERMFHAKVDEVRKKLEAYHEQKRHAGAASGRTRRERSFERHANERSADVPTEDEPSPSPSPAPSPAPSQPRSQSSLQALSGRFNEWWKIWSDKRGTNHRIPALHAYGAVVTVPLEQDCFECTRSYLDSLSDPTKGYNPENFIYEQAKDLFRARWPRAAPNGKKGDFMADVADVIGAKLARGEKPW